VPPELLLPERAWPNTAAFLDTLLHLANMFVSNFKELTNPAAARAGVEKPTWESNQNQDLIQKILTGGPAPAAAQLQMQQEELTLLPALLPLPAQP
jgi:hypothetical protein